MQKADATDTNTGDCRTGRATLNTTGILAQAVATLDLKTPNGSRGVYRWHQTPEHHRRGGWKWVAPVIRLPNDHALSPRAICAIGGSEGAADTHGDLRIARHALRTRRPFPLVKREAQPIYRTSDESNGSPPTLPRPRR
jgi:hypothetical protein